MSDSKLDQQRRVTSTTEDTRHQSTTVVPTWQENQDGVPPSPPRGPPALVCGRPGLMPHSHKKFGPQYSQANAPLMEEPGMALTFEKLQLGPYGMPIDNPEIPPGVMPTELIRQVWPQGPPPHLPQRNIDKEYQALPPKPKNPMRGNGIKQSTRKWMSEVESRQTFLPPKLSGIGASGGVCSCAPGPGIDTVVPYECPFCRHQPCSCPCFGKLSCCKRPPPPVPAKPEIVVKHISTGHSGYKCKCQPACAGGGCKNCPGFKCNFAECLGSHLACCKVESPPWPVPTNPLGFATCMDEDVMKRKAEKNKGSCCGLCGPAPPPPPKTGGGLKEFIKDSIGLGALAAAEVCETLGNMVYATVGPLPEVPLPQPGDPRLPDPRDGQYHARPLTATRHTGWWLIDRINETLDDLLLDQPEDFTFVDMCPGDAPPPPTEQTGNALIDRANELLDRLLVPAPKTDEVVVDTPPREKSTFQERVQCLIHCRDKCSYDRWDCSGLRFQKSCLARKQRDEVQPTWWQRVFRDCRRKQNTYKEKFGERLWPAIYGREHLYCKWCDRGPSGNKRVKLDFPKFQCPCVCERSPADYDEVDFDMRTFAPVPAAR